MQIYHCTSPTCLESIRLYHLITQLYHSQLGYLHTYNSIQRINSQWIKKFLENRKVKTNRNFIEFMNQNNKKGKQMKELYWGECISQRLKHVQLASWDDYNQSTSQLIIQVVSQNYIEPLFDFEKWDNLGELDNQKKLLNEQNVFAKCKQLDFFINRLEPMFLDAHLQIINQCFSLININPSKKQQICQIYEKILNSPFITSFQFCLGTNVSENIFVKMLQSLCYIYSGLKYDKVRAILQNSFLLYPQIIMSLSLNVQSPQPRIRRFTWVMLSIIANRIESPLNLFKNEEQLTQICKSISNVDQQSGLNFGIQFFIVIIKQLSKKQKLSEREVSMLRSFFHFAHQTIMDSKNERTQQSCFKLIMQCIKAIDFDEESLRQLQLLKTVFKAPPKKQYYRIFQLSIDIVKFSFIYNRENIQSFIFGQVSSSLESYLKRLIQNRQSWQPIFSVLHLFMIISEKNCDLLFQRNLIQQIFRLKQLPNGLILQHLSYIVLSLVKNSIESQWKLTYLFEKKCLETVGFLLKFSMIEDEDLKYRYNLGQDVCYNNIQIFLNSIQTLYILHDSSSKFLIDNKKEHHKKYFSHIQMIQSLQFSISMLFENSKNKKYLTLLLQSDQEIQAQNKKQVKLCDIILTIIEQMTFHLRKKVNDKQNDLVLKRVNSLRNKLLSYFYPIFSYKTLVAHKIPIYMIYSLSLQGRNYHKRTLPLSWRQLRYLIQSIIKKNYDSNAEIQSYSIYQEGKQIRAQDQYQRIVQRTLNNYQYSKFSLEAFVSQVKFKQSQSETFRQSFRSVRSQFPNDRQNSFRESYRPNNNSFQYRESERTSPHRNQSPGHHSRDFSPNFGILCKYCRQYTTKNRTEICDKCTENYHVR